MRVGMVGVALAVGLLVASCATGRVAGSHPAALVRPCAARTGGAVQWLTPSAIHRTPLDRWCEGVGAPVVWAAPGPPSPVPALADLTVVTWNAQLGHGRLVDLIADLRAGSMTSGRPVHHFVVLLQEAFRRGSDVPDFAHDARSATTIVIRDDAPDARALAHSLGLSLVYVPSMRNGARQSEDRGSAIISTEPLLDPVALELPFERQRRVVVGATLEVIVASGVEALRVVNVHLDPVSGAGRLWLFHNPRRRQLAAVGTAIDAMPPVFGTVLGGDFNTVQAGAGELVSQSARAWSTSLVADDPRATHRAGRLDYLYFRLSAPWLATTTRAERRYGSDHFPVVGRFLAGTSE